MYGMDCIRVVVANELRSYREAISQVFAKLHPDIEVSAIEPGDLDREVELLRPDFVVCSRTTSAVELMVPAWVELYTDFGASSQVSVRGETTTVEAMQLTDLIDLLDRIRGLATTLG